MDHITRLFCNMFQIVSESRIIYESLTWQHCMQFCVWMIYESGWQPISLTTHKLFASTMFYVWRTFGQILLRTSHTLSGPRRLPLNRTKPSLLLDLARNRAPFPQQQTLTLVHESTPFSGLVAINCLPKNANFVKTRRKTDFSLDWRVAFSCCVGGVVLSRSLRYSLLCSSNGNMKVARNQTRLQNNREDSNE